LRREGTEMHSQALEVLTKECVLRTRSCAQGVHQLLYASVHVREDDRPWRRGCVRLTMDHFVKVLPDLGAL
jgi:hypothetical protein